MKRVGVVGAGPMGRLHARTVRRSADRGSEFELTRVFDRHRGRAEELGDEFGAAACEDLREFYDEVDVAIVAVPTAAHFEVANGLLESGLDVLVEKPFVSEVVEGESLIAAATGGQRILQVGHVEWYNPSWREAAKQVGRVRRIDVDRLQPPSDRGRDIDVIQDLMLHDLDWTTRWIGGSILEVEAGGRAERGQFEEVDAEIHFEGGCVARLRSSRMYEERRRTARFEGDAGAVTVNLEAARSAGGTSVSGGRIASLGRDPLELQWRDFMNAVESRIEPVNSGGVGVDALRLVARVRDAIASNSDAAEREP